MSLAALVRTLLLGSILLLVFGLGLRSTVGDADYLFRRPGLLARSLIAMYVVMPLVVIGVLLQLDLRPPVKIALVALALSPVPPFLPSKQMKLSGSKGYIYGLLIAASVLAVVWVPFVTWLFSARFGHGLRVQVPRVVGIVSLTVLLPLAAGMIVRHYLPERSIRLSRVLSAVGTALLIVAFIPVLAAQGGALRSLIGDGTLLAIIVFTAIGLLIGHLLGGPDPENETVLALATASRHPAVALAIASTIFPEQRLAPAAVLLALIVGMLAAFPYTAWRRRVHTANSKGDAGLSSTRSSSK